MDINDMTIGQARELSALLGGGSSGTGGWEIGKNYLIRTVTHIQTGRVVAVDQNEIALENACWIADTGRFSGALETCDFNEIEPFPQSGRVLVGRGALIDAVQIPSLPSSQK